MTTIAINLYDDKGSCELCSSTFVRRRVDDLDGHAREHLKAGDPVLNRDRVWLIEVPQ